MAQCMAGAPVVDALCSQIRTGVTLLHEKGIVPTAAIVRVGERPADLSYEKGFTKRAHSLGIEVKKIFLPENASEVALLHALYSVNEDSSIHGCLLFRPLPERLNTLAVMEALRPEKDIDAMTSVSMGNLITRNSIGFSPCTATACMEMLRCYKVPLQGKHAVVVGAGPAVGMPTAILLMNEGATVSVCNIFTELTRLTRLCQEADVIISAAGKAALIGRDHVRPGQIVIDVGISPGSDGKLHGDVDFDAVEPVVAGLTPVPGGVGAVTSTVLAAHVLEAALRVNGLSADRNVE